MSDLTPPLIYLDSGATTRVDPRVVDAMLPYFTESFGNPSSSHPLGLRSRRAVEHARAQVGSALGVDASRVTFTSGGTEALNLALRGAIAAKAKPHFVVSALEHPAVTDTVAWAETLGGSSTVIGVDESGVVSADDVLDAVRPDTAVVAIMMANNEIGTIQPIEEIGRRLKIAAPDVLFVVDAVQAFTKCPLPLRAESIDALAISSHKIHGPKGVGALYLREAVTLPSMQTGGGQEGRIRPGTENLTGIVGLGCAAELATSDAQGDADRMRALRDALWSGLQERLPELSLNGCPERRLANNLSVNFHGCATPLLKELVAESGLAVSAGAACHAASTSISAVLRAIGLQRDEGTLRLTLCRHSTLDEVERAIEILADAVPKARRGH